MSRLLRNRVANLERRVFGGRGGGALALILEAMGYDLATPECQAELRRWGHLTLEQLIWKSWGDDGILVLEVPGRGMTCVH